MINLVRFVLKMWEKRGKQTVAVSCAVSNCAVCSEAQAHPVQTLTRPLVFELVQKVILQQKMEAVI